MSFSRYAIRRSLVKDVIRKLLYLDSVTARHVENVLCRKYSPRNFIRAAISLKVYLLKILSRRPCPMKYLLNGRNFGNLYYFVVRQYYSLNSQIHRVGYIRHAELDFPSLEKLISRANIRMAIVEQSRETVVKISLKIERYARKALQSDRRKSNIRFDLMTNPRIGLAKALTRI